MYLITWPELSGNKDVNTLVESVDFISVSDNELHESIDGHFSTALMENDIIDILTGVENMRSIV